MRSKEFDSTSGEVPGIDNFENNLGVERPGRKEFYKRTGPRTISLKNELVHSVKLTEAEFVFTSMGTGNWPIGATPSGSFHESGRPNDRRATLEVPDEASADAWERALDNNGYKKGE
ncbi:hypothetical protein A2714_00570 [Candidatus Woesebacteria bacterium RIFCSPHIGHO2_01_FULL_38_9]|uniref:Uncharacterized protein n=2 Tax=Candidatus Woeseibacteriota TaxID=1752722 RepID=A0A1F7Y218_9BACT|nr:MAG: hypothetical protein A2714_00570 [Candidatus Woesebacteria bacterium RIFCSPHIGHO2_01_FULL_38_9]OGM61066.1 MAG: hypothetical protein A3A75_02810 [Candidatus Woesebacteria bacterium RIFCSPLOWO2_01_FULL_39_10]